MHSLAWKISVPIIVSIWILFGIAGWMAYQARVQSTTMLVESCTQTNLRILAEAFRNIMLAGRPEHARALLEEFQKALYLTQVEALSPDGKHYIVIGELSQNTKKENVMLQVTFTTQQQCSKCHSIKSLDSKGYLRAHVNLKDYILPIKTWHTKALVIHLLASLFLTVFIHGSVVYWVRRPMKHLLNQMDSVAKGNFDAFVPTQTNDEVGIISQHFKRTLDKIKELEKKRREMQQKELERAQHLASIGEMAATLAHEIKNPIAGIASALNVLFDQSHLNDETREVYQFIQADLNRVNRIVEDLLQYARPKPMDVDIISLKEVLAEVTRRLEAVAHQHEVTLRIRIENHVPAIKADRQQMHQLFYNVILNAIQASPPHTQVNVNVSYDELNDIVIIKIIDQGIGIPTEKLEKIFKPFYSTKERGTGLGLSICARIIENHNGKIHVDSEPGRGTCFTMMLPRDYTQNGGEKKG